MCEHGKFLPAPWRTTQGSPFPSTSTQSAGNLGVPGGTLERIMHRRTQYGHRHTPTTSRLSPSSRASRGGARLPPTTPAHHGPKQPSLGNPTAPPQQFLAHLKPPPSWPAPTPGRGVVLRSLALVCPAGNDPQCCTAPLCSLEGTYFGHPSPPQPTPLPGQRQGSSLELSSGLFPPMPRRPPPAARPRAPAGSPATPSRVPGGPAARGQGPPDYLEAAGGACTCSPSSPPAAACR